MLQLVDRPEHRAADPIVTAQPVEADFNGINNLITTVQTRAGQAQADEAGG